ncbi:hypothetical protein KJ763_01495 [Patescibacteria group bacterium]|nr:hypothetical protein [Patescibacteria group bacterium]
MIFGENFSKIIVLIFLLILATHAIAIYFSLYWIIWWFDNAMHFLGGLCLSFFAIWLIYFAKKIELGNTSNFFSLIIIVSLVVLGGVFWEFFEFFFDNIIFGKISGLISLAGHAQLGLVDTMSDLFFDLLGGLLGGLLFLKKHDKK